MILPEIKSLDNEDICILVKFDNHSGNYICECGDASKLTVKECQDTKAIFISHTHIDHFVNFDFILRHQIGTGKRIIICGPQGITKQVQSRILAYTWNLIEEESITYEIREIIDETNYLTSELRPPLWEIKELGEIEDTPILSNEKFDVNYTILNHKTPSISYLFKENDSVKIDMTSSEFRGGKWVNELKLAFEAKDNLRLIKVADLEYKAKDLFHLLKLKIGASLGVIMDHAAIPENHEKILSLFSNCDKVFIESFYKEEDKESAELNFHSYSKASGRIMRECQVQEAIPVHFSRKYKSEEISEIMEEFESEFKT
ncbi:MAG: ribonuclease Z [Saprospiraceae bacterium]|jgi:ribonuclease Z